MPLSLFQKVLLDCSNYTNLITLHILGDPLKMPNIKEYLTIAYNCNLNVEITTSGIYLDEFEFLLQPPIRQVNISLDAVMEIPSPNLRDKIFKKIFDFCYFRQDFQSDTFINLRIQNKKRNKELLHILQKAFDTPPVSLDVNTRIGKKTIIVIKEPFLWNVKLDSNARLDSNIREDSADKEDSRTTAESNMESNYTKGYCYALSEHFGILANGDVVPCCIDAQGNIVLGNIARDSIAAIFKFPRTKAMLEGFKDGFIVESFCKTCDYRKRFN